MIKYEQIVNDLKQAPRKWLVTGAAGFIGSHLVETLLKADQDVVGLDNFSTGYRHNLNAIQHSVSAKQWSRFDFVKGDICDIEVCRDVTASVDYVLHQAALGSVPRSINDPCLTNSNNVCGFLNMLVASRDAAVRSFTYAASSSTYGDHPVLPKEEATIGSPLSPYAVTKYVNELYAEVFSRCYQFHSTGLRYFNVFGPRQDPDGAYAAVIPKWTSAMFSGESICINGDGESSRDFCFVANAVQANVLAAVAACEGSRVFNVAVGDRTTLNELYELLREGIKNLSSDIEPACVHGDFRSGDVRHSQASIAKIQAELGYEPQYKVRRGLEVTCAWFVNNRIASDESQSL